MSVHVLVPGDWTVQRGHRLLEALERDLRAALPATTVFIHLEPLNDPASWADTGLDRAPAPASPPAARRASRPADGQVP
jgi:Dimerisation domain of Zinc Transporter